MPKTSSQKNKESILIKEDFFTSFKKAVQPPSLPDIITFAEDPAFCGKKLYPRQKTLLKLIFLEKENLTDYDMEVIDDWTSTFYYGGEEGQERIGIAPDVLERIDILREQNYSHFREVEFIGGRRGGKGHIGGIIGAYLAFRLITLDNPQWYYGIDTSKDLYSFVTATSQSQARDYQFKDIVETITGAPCFENFISTNKNLFMSMRTPADVRRIAELEQRNITVEREIASVRIMALSSNSRAGRGSAAYGLFFDEMAHMLNTTDGPNTAGEVYKALTPSLDQLGKDAFIYIPTSPYTKVGAAYEIYQAALEKGPDGTPSYPNRLVIQLPSWSPYEDWDNPKIVNVGHFRGAPQEYDEEMRQAEKFDYDAFKVERKAQWAEVVNAYLNPRKVDEMFLPIENKGELQVLENFTPGFGIYEYRGHADPSKSNANTALAIAHTELFPDEETGERVAHVIIDWMQVWRPGDFEDNIIDYMDIKDEMLEIISMFPTLKTFSYDQYGGFITVPMLKQDLRSIKHRARVKEATFTAKSNAIRQERFKSALYAGWVHAPKDTLGPDKNSLLELELKYLQDNNGRVSHQTVGAIQTDDLADCVMEIVSELLADQLDRYYRNKGLGRSRLALGGQGGYHTGGIGIHGVSGEEAKSRLTRIATAGKPTYGVSMGRNKRRSGNSPSKNMP